MAVDIFVNDDQVDVTATEEQVTNSVVPSVVIRKGDDGISPVVSISAIEGGHRITITDADGEKSVDVLDGKNGSPGVPVADYGAKGDGSTDDTTAFQKALKANRVVFVPGGTYKLSGELKIGHHCELELSPDTVLNFTQKTGNCITLGIMGSLKGNHAVIEVPYDFTGNVINLNDYDVTAEQYKRDVPPWNHYSPQHKYGRFVTDVNIGKVDGYGIHRSVDGWTGGTAVYLTTDDQYDCHSVWAAHFYNIRIAGAFDYGIRAKNFGEGWNHDMRIEATIEACKIGVSLENCHCAFVDAVIQPVPATDSKDKVTLYAENGIRLVDCLATDLSRSRVWDWDVNKTKYAESVENRSIAMYGSCRGTIISDFVCYWSSTNFKDTRDSIYTDTPSNLETMTILQEPITRWFKPKDGEPFFYDGYSNKRLALKEDVDAYFQTNGQVQAYTDVKSPYQENVCPADSGGAIIARDGNLYIEPKEFAVGDVVRIRGIDFTSNWPGIARAYLFYKDTGVYRGAINFASLIAQSPTGSLYNDEGTYEWDGETKTLTVTFTGSQAGSILSTYKYGFGGAYASGYNIKNVVMTVNEEIKFTQVGLLADSIKVKAENVIGGGSGTSSGSGGGSGVDVTAAVGQTIVVEEVDENGKPTKWKAADYQERTHHEDVEWIVPETTIAFNPDDGGWFYIYGTERIVLTTGEQYVVNWNGKDYICPCMELDYGAQILGNPYNMGDVPHSNEPFYVFFATPEEVEEHGLIVGVGDVNADKTHQWPEEITVSVAKKTVHKIEPKYLPEGVGYSEVKEILPEITVEIDPEAGMGVIPVDFTVEGGKEYTVKYNGVEYVTNCVEMGGIFALGNAGAMQEGLPVTEEPFLLAYTAVDEDDSGNPIMAWAVGALDGSASVTLSIDGETVHKIPEKFVDPSVFYVDVYGDDTFTTEVTYGQLKKALDSGKNIVARVFTGDASETGASSVAFLALVNVMSYTLGSYVPVTAWFANATSLSPNALSITADLRYGDSPTSDTAYTVSAGQ